MSWIIAPAAGIVKLVRISLEYGLMYKRPLTKAGFVIRGLGFGGFDYQRAAKWAKTAKNGGFKRSIIFVQLYDLMLNVVE